MATFTEVFKRKEVKYCLSYEQYCYMVEQLRGRMVVDGFGKGTIISLYFDTPQRMLIDRSLEKPLYKEKLRLRSYGTPQEDDRVYVELKKKFKGIVYKRRVGMSYAAARAYIGGMPYKKACALHPLPDELMAQESVSARSLQIAHEIDAFVRRYQPLRASMIICCDRTAYAPDPQAPAGQVPGDLRITFDQDIQYSDLFDQAVVGSQGKPLLDQGQAIMEIKSTGPFPLWLTQLLATCDVYPSSFSKYGQAYLSCDTAPRAARDAAADAPVEAEPEPLSTAAAFSRQRLASAVPSVAGGPSVVPRRRPRAAAPDAAAKADITATLPCMMVPAEQHEHFAHAAPDSRARRFLANRKPLKKGGRCA